MSDDEKPADITRAPKPPPFPIGTRLVCVSDRGDITACTIGPSGRDYVRTKIYGKGIEVVIDEVILGRQGTGNQLRDQDGLMFYDEGDPILSETEDGMSVYHVTAGSERQGRMIRHENRGEWKVIPASTPLTVGDTYGDILSWRWDRARMRFTAEHSDRLLVVQFHKIGGRHSRTLPDGSPNPSGRKGYWTSMVEGDRSLAKYDTADEAKAAATVEYRRRFVDGVKTGERDAG